MTAIVNWATTLTSPKQSQKIKRVGLFLLVITLTGLAVAGYWNSARNAPSPTLLAERVEVKRSIPHAPEPGINREAIEIGQPLLPTTAIQVSRPATPDPLLIEHSKKLADLDAVVSQVKGDITGMASRLDAFQTELQGIKQQLAQHPTVLPKATHPRQHGKENAVQNRQHRQRTKVNTHAGSKPTTPSTPALQIVAVNNWGTESRIIVREQNSGHYRQLRIGDPLSNGTIVSMNAHQITIQNAHGLAIVDLNKGRP